MNSLRLIFGKLSKSAAAFSTIIVKFAIWQKLTPVCSDNTLLVHLSFCRDKNSR